MKPLLCGFLAILPPVALAQAKPLPDGHGAGANLATFAKNAHLLLAQVIVRPTAKNRPIFLALTERLAYEGPRAADDPKKRAQLRKILADLIGTAQEHRIVAYGVVQTPVQTPLEDVRIDVVLVKKGGPKRRYTFIWATAPQKERCRLLSWAPTPG